MRGTHVPGRAARLLLAAWLSASAAAAADAPVPPIVMTRHLLVVTHTTGYRHPSIPTAEATLAALAQQSDREFDVTFCRNASDVALLMSPAGLAGFDGVFFANTSGDLGLPNLAAFLDWIRAGHAFLGTHSATDTYRNQPAYLEMIGGEFRTHGQQCQVDIRVESARHPSTAPIYPSLAIFDEIYEFQDNNRDRVRVLLSLDHHPPDGHPEAGQPGDFILGWHKLHGNGRVFYTALGHRSDVWLDSRFQAHLRGAISWALAAPISPASDGATTLARAGSPAR